MLRDTSLGRMSDLRPTPLIVPTRRIDLLDRYRVPYAIEPTADAGLIEIGSGTGEGSRLVSIAARPHAAERLYRLDGCALFTALPPESVVSATLRRLGDRWEVVSPILDASG